jgi:hypothetical protein
VEKGMIYSQLRDLPVVFLLNTKKDQNKNKKQVSYDNK